MSLLFVSSNYFIILKGPGLRSRWPVTKLCDLEKYPALWPLSLPSGWGCQLPAAGITATTMSAPFREPHLSGAGRPLRQGGQDTQGQAVTDWQTPQLGGQRRFRTPPASPAYWLMCTALNTWQLSPHASVQGHSLCTYPPHTHTPWWERAGQRDREPLYQQSDHWRPMT